MASIITTEHGAQKAEDCSQPAWTRPWDVMNFVYLVICTQKTTTSMNFTLKGHGGNRTDWGRQTYSLIMNNCRTHLYFLFIDFIKLWWSSGLIFLLETFSSIQLYSICIILFYIANLKKKNCSSNNLLEGGSHNIFDSVLYSLIFYYYTMFLFSYKQPGVLWWLFRDQSSSVRPQTRWTEPRPQLMDGREGQPVLSTLWKHNLLDIVFCISGGWG